MIFHLIPNLQKKHLIAIHNTTIIFSWNQPLIINLCLGLNHAFSNISIRYQYHKWYRAKTMTLYMGLFLIGVLALSCLSTTSIFNQQQNQALAQQYIQTIKYRNVVIDLGNGVKTNAQLTYPAIGKNTVKTLQE
jgi:hypothetical protein